MSARQRPMPLTCGDASVLGNKPRWCLIPPISNLRDGRAEALHALVNSLTPGQNFSSESSSKEDEVPVLSEKLKELLKDVDPSQEDAQRNERGELLNEEGLPIIEINEPMERVPDPSPGASSGAGPIDDAEDGGFVPIYRLSPAERLRRRAQMDRILDRLEEEERVEEERNRARDREQRREELEQRKANAKAELERVKAAKEMQKKMGKALLKNMADAREKEERDKARQEKEDLELEEARRSRKPRKSVSWAELPRQEKQTSERDDAWARAPARAMRPHVVERFPARSGAPSPPSPPIPVGDSDDETDPEHSPSDGSQDEDEAVDSHRSEDGFDFDLMQHQREIALAYFEKRNAIGTDATCAMASRTHDLGDENEWDQEDVPLDATLAGPRPKPSQSRFRTERRAQTYDTRQPSLTSPAPLEPSVLPHPIDGLRSAVCMGRLEADQLLGNSDSDGEDEAARTRDFINALYRGDVTNAGAAENSDALIAALESAYGAPSKQLAAPAIATESVVASVPSKTALLAQKNSRFKPGGVARPLPTRNTVVERKTALSPSSIRPQATIPSPSDPPGTVAHLPAISQLPSMIVGSPSFPPPLTGDVPMTIVDSPSFCPPIPGPSARPTRPPAVLTSVHESSGTQMQQQARVLEPGKPVSRFKAQLAKS
ncbi:hypothetical protein F5148DRAFT_735061 [Russula earlei]|uniref:Uncharacterized protein n=1 Tax=Russula earlei TaxID=71964 RepID=A0ACC0UEW2_9AGAM|nr:hypothetical protein F5148DRAFT_735061 [Russula earlei]